MSESTGTPVQPSSNPTQPPSQTGAPHTGEQAAQPTKRQVLDQWASKLLGIDAQKFAQAIAGRGKPDPITGKRPAERIVQMIEDSANANKGPAQPKAHALSAHGPGTDQVPRLLSGRRADEKLEEDHTGQTPAATVHLAKTDGSASMDAPEWTTVGNDPSNVSSRFKDAEAMLLTLEEAFAQAALLQSQIAADEKGITAQAMADKTNTIVAEAADALGKARGAAAKQRAAAKKAGEELEALKAKTGATTEELDKATTQYETAVKSYATASQGVDKAVQDLRAAKKAYKPDAFSDIGQDRQVFVVEPSAASKDPTKPADIGESMSVGGAALKKGEPLTQQQMQERFDTMKTSSGLTKAGVVLDPAHVVDEFGQKHQAGFQVQTAFPTADGKANRTPGPDDFKKTRHREQADAAVAPEREAAAKEVEALEAIQGARAAKKTQLKAAVGKKTDLEDRMAVLDPDYPEDDFVEKVRARREKIEALNAEIEKAGGTKLALPDASVTTPEQRKKLYDELALQLKDAKAEIATIRKEAEPLSKQETTQTAVTNTAKTALAVKQKKAEEEYQAKAEQVDAAAIKAAEGDLDEAVKMLAEQRKLQQSRATNPSDQPVQAGIEKSESEQSVASSKRSVEASRRILAEKLTQQSETRLSAGARALSQAERGREEADQKKQEIQDALSQLPPDCPADPDEAKEWKVAGEKLPKALKGAEQNTVKRAAAVVAAKKALDELTEKHEEVLKTVKTLLEQPV